MRGDRGVIRNREAAQRLYDLSGMRWGNATPSNLDLFVELHNRVFVFIEIKHGGAPMSPGQRLAFERLVDSVGADKTKRAIFIVASDDSDIHVDIPVRLSVVREYRLDGKWHELSRKIVLKEFVDRFVKHELPFERIV